MFRPPRPRPLRPRRPSLGPPTPAALPRVLETTVCTACGSAHLLPNVEYDVVQAGDGVVFGHHAAIPRGIPGPKDLDAGPHDVCSKTAGSTTLGHRLFTTSCDCTAHQRSAGAKSCLGCDLQKVIGSNGISTIGARGAKLGDGWGDGSVSSCLGLTGGVVASRPLAWSERAVAERQSRCILTAELVPRCGYRESARDQSATHRGK